MDRFVNPYNFISLKGECKRGKDYKTIKEEGGLLTGWIECDLRTLSSIFIPNTTNNDFFNRRTIEEKPKQIKSYDFFSYTNLEGKSAPQQTEPVIPGSEIRGMIRSAFEAVTNSCMSTVDDGQLLYKRTSRPAANLGILKKQSDGNWKIKTCKKYMLKVYACDKDPHFINYELINPDLWKALKNIKKNGSEESYFSYIYNRNRYTYYTYNLDKEFREINKKLSLTPGGELRYHTKMTDNEKEKLLKLSNDPYYISAIDSLYINSQGTTSQNYYDRDELKAKENEPIWFKAGGKYARLPYMNEIVKEISFEEQTGAGWLKGFLHIGEDIDNKHHESIFYPDTEEPSITDETSVKNLLENMKLYNDKAVNIHLKDGKHSCYKHMNINNIDDLDGTLIYYQEHNGNYYLSPAAIGREVFYNKLSDNILGSYSPCTKSNNLCPACALFGISGDEDAVASRVRFTDTFITDENKKVDPNDYFEDDKILPELASPKISATEFYLQKPANNALMWNYDYAVTQWGKVGEINTYINPYTPAIRGRKFYWHQQSQTPPIDPDKASERNVAVRPLKKDENNKFHFKVYFNDITSEELRKLIWVLEIGGNPDNAHKIGMGKPLGLGSVKISIEKVMLRSIALNKNTIEYNIIEDVNYLDNTRGKTVTELATLLGCSPVVLKEFLKITDFNNAPDFNKAPNYVSYPMNVNGDKIYEWFVKNKGPGMTPRIQKSLPEIGDTEQRLDKYR